MSESEKKLIENKTHILRDGFRGASRSLILSP